MPLWLISSDANAANAVSLLDDYSGFLVYGSKEPKLWARYGKCYGVETAVSIKIVGGTKTADLAHKIISVLPENKCFAVFDNAWLCEMLACLIKQKVANVKSNNSYKFPQVLHLSQECHEYTLVSDRPDLWHKGCQIFSLD